MTTAGQISVFEPSEAAYKAAAEALAQGHLVILPTETVYGIFGSKSHPSALTGLIKFFGQSHAASAGWHAASVEIALQHAQTYHPQHQRFVERLLPGPVGIIFKPGDSVRVPDNAAALAVLQTAYDAGLTDVVGVRLIGTLFRDGEVIRPALADANMYAKLQDAGVRVAIDCGQAALGKPSTIIKLAPDGSYQITRQGPVGERYINDRLRKHVLFVCTGNTCRSPMAETIARKIATEPEGMISFSSAGIMAGENMAMTPEAAKALTALGYEPHDHRSKQISERDIQNADEIYGLTDSHVLALQDAFPGSAWKIALLDQGGTDIPDPIGASAHVYHQTCQTLEKFIERRLAGTISQASKAGKGTGS